MLVHNIHGFKGQDLIGRGEFEAYQGYESLEPNRTKLTFAARTVHTREVLAALMFVKVGQDIKRTFWLNLENIKEAIEVRRDGREYRRLHPHIET